MFVDFIVEAKDVDKEPVYPLIYTLVCYNRWVINWGINLWIRI